MAARLRVWLISRGLFDSLFLSLNIGIVSLLVLRISIPGGPEDPYYLQGISAYLLLSVSAFGVCQWLQLPVQRFIAKPRLHWLSVLAITIVVGVSISIVRSGGYEYVSPLKTILGIAFIFLIGFGEEFTSRMVIFGLLERFGTYLAVFASSLIFGLLHLNLYLSEMRWQAYIHVMNAFGFGLFICSVVIVTRSIWVGIIFHAMADWGVSFDPASNSDLPEIHQSALQWIGDGLFQLTYFVPLAIALLALHRFGIPKVVKRCLLKPAQRLGLVSE